MSGWTHYCAVTPSDTVDAPYVSEELYFGGDGNLVAVGLDGQARPSVHVLGGHTYKIRARRINASGTTATGLVFFHNRASVTDSLSRVLR